MRIIIATAILSLFLIGCSSKDTTVVDETKVLSPKPEETSSKPVLALPTLSDEELQTEYEKRIPIKLAFLASAKDIAEKVDSDEVVRIYNFVARGGILAIPFQGGGYQAVEKPLDEERYFNMVVLLPEDEALGAPWNEFSRAEGSSALYSSDHGAMVIQDSISLSDESMGLTLLHEGVHAWDAIVNDLHPIDAVAFCVGEIKAHEFEDRVLSKLHPNTYDKFVQEVSNLIFSMKTDMSVTVKDVFEFINEGLNDAFEREIEADHDIGGLSTHMFYTANFKLYDKHLPPNEREGAKIGFLKNWLEGTGAAQW